MHSKIFKKIGNIFLDILIVIFGLILIITVYNDVQIKVLNKSYADFFGYTTFEVQTGSMSPTINANDLIIVKRGNTPKIRDIITYKKGDDFITHRVVEAYKETYVTKGDANNAKDEAIKKDQIVGTVIKIIPNFGAFRQTLLNPVVLITLIVTVYILSRLFSNKPLFKIKVQKRKKEKEPFEDLEDETDEETPVSVNITKQEDIDEEEIERLKKILENAEVEEENPEEKEESTEKLEEPVEEEIDEEESTEPEILEEKEETTEPEVPEEEKTIYFRKISVDSNDLNQKRPIIEEEEEEEPILIEEEVQEEEETAKLKAIKKKHKKFNNIVEKAMSIKEEEINEIISILDNTRLRPNEATIKDMFTKIYIDAKYYNHCGNISVDYNSKNMCSKLEEVLKTESSRIIKEYRGNDPKYSEKVLKYQALYELLVNIDHINTLYEEINTKVEAYKKKMTKYLILEDKDISRRIKEIINVQRICKKLLNDTLNSVETSTFELHYNPLTTNKNIYGLVLDHNISFSKVYSNYIISKTYDEGVVAEDKILVLLSMLLNKIANDMVNGNFKNKYLLYLPITLYSKETKLNHILKQLDDEFVKNSVLILVKSSVIVNKKKLFKDLKKQGYQIAIVYDNNEVKDKDNPIYSVATYVFVDKKAGKNINFDILVPDAIVLENILTKVDIPRGEE